MVETSERNQENRPLMVETTERNQGNGALIVETLERNQKKRLSHGENYRQKSRKP